MVMVALPRQLDPIRQSPGVPVQRSRKNQPDGLVEGPMGSARQKAPLRCETCGPYHFLDPAILRKVLLSAYSEEEWKQRKPAQTWRSAKTQIPGRNEPMSLFNVVMIYALQKYNRGELERTGKCEHITLHQIQTNPRFKWIRNSSINNATLKEMLELAGIDYGNAFVKGAFGLNLLDPVVLRRFLLNAQLDGKPWDLLGALRDGKFELSTFFWKVSLRDPETGIKIKGQTFLIVYALKKHQLRHPGASYEELRRRFFIECSTDTLREALKVAGLDGVAANPKANE